MHKEELESEADLARRHGDRRVAEVPVDEERRKSNRRSTPGLAGLLKDLFVRKTGEKH